MRAILQRVSFANVKVDQQITGEIKNGIMALIGFDENDNQKDFDYIFDKTLNLRIFEDENDKMNLSVKDLNYGILFIPNFTLYADARKGRRPSFAMGAKPETARKLYSDFIEYAKNNYEKIQSGVFQADMKVELLNDGPVTIMLDSSKLF